VKWFRAAAEQGLAEAQFNLAQRYEHGQGVAKSPAEALVWFSLAAAQGIPDAVKSAAEMRAALSPEQIAEAEKRVAAFVAKTGLPGGK
jgi:TPR repeat protein